ncbi:hypothetical protein ACQ4N7_28470 [Nodosilinea sp. AN01ver1]|uniref:hypothetical protein n=1 Tax=Nodosilinea sp. AN01ver1 TaxID=3423362 RepID=UPI003D3228D5
MSLTVDEVLSSMFAPPTPPADNIWRQVCYRITAPIRSDQQPQFSKDYNQLILVELIRRKWNKKFRVRGLSRATARQLKAVGAVAEALLNLISAVQEVAPEALGYRHQAEWFEVLLLESEAIGWAFKGDFSGKREIVRHRATQNRKVNALENPFTSACTQTFFSVVLPIAEQDNPSVLKAVRAFTKARSALNKSENIEGTGCYRLAATGADALVKRGRKKDVPETLTG